MMTGKHPIITVSPGGSYLILKHSGYPDLHDQTGRKKGFDCFSNQLESEPNLGLRAEGSRRRVFSYKFFLVRLMRDFLGNSSLSALSCSFLLSGLIWHPFFLVWR
jgi:hypothetical protein